MFRSALLILSGNAASAMLLLARNLLVARLIPVADYGIASTFIIAMAVVEMMSQLGLQQQIVQSDKGEDPRFQAALQGFHVLRGVISGSILFLLAHPIANLMNVPHAAWAYQVMALVPALHALSHFDIHRLNRTMVFGPMVLSATIPALVSLLAVWPLAVWLGDYRVMLYAMLIQAVLTVVTSHLVSTRKYRLILDPEVIGGALRFGWPLLINGILMFAIFNGDKVIVGRELGMEVLAIFAMGVTLTLTPTLVLAKSAQNFFLPQIVARKDDPEALRYLARITIQVGLLLGPAFAVLIALVGEPVVYLLLGDKYAALLPFMVWLAVLQAIRVAKTGPSIVALAIGHTENPMVANLFRVFSLPLVWYVAVATQDLYAIIWIAIAAELLGYVAALLLLWLRSGVVPGGLVLPHLAVTALLVFICARAGLAPAVSGPQFGDLWSWLGALGLLGLLAASMGTLMRYALRRGQSATPSGGSGR